MISSKELLTNAMQLPEKERAEIAHHLLLSLETDDFDDNEIATAWQEEVESRLKRVADGNYTAHDWREAMNEVRQSLR